MSDTVSDEVETSLNDAVDELIKGLLFGVTEVGGKKILPRLVEMLPTHVVRLQVDHTTSRYSSW
jgi:hypothetical protein